ncbi:sporulation integral membrane protein YlbJ [Paenibacillus selenitireducens]|uniref:Sporulation integral membrane protein YlbJ n=2 Tax=Paenibacillus selenitireducens TaxID=1324314 RepID=A0A1T2XL61_9BACL|nr:sporulation integral membrane protein YlbJ [Paenibacillus selenitireducens]
MMMIYPHATLEASVRGLSIWWDVLFPALFPFFVISEMLLGFGIVHFVGTLLDPLMRPLFRIPGTGGFVVAISYASGYPVGAKLTAQLWDQRLVTREEGERLVAFTTTSDPIFLIGAVSVGFFHDVGVAPILAIAHYGAGTLIGFLMRFHGSRAIPSPFLSSSAGHQGLGRIRQALRAMHQARLRDGRDLGLLIRESLRSSLKLMMVVGGLVVFFSVILELLTAAHVMNGLYSLIQSMLGIFGIPPELSQSIVNGIFEVTLGAKSAGAAGTSIPLVYQLSVAAFVLSWGGLSVHAQVASILNATNLRYWPFLIARLSHGLLAMIFVFLIY